MIQTNILIVLFVENHFFLCHMCFTIHFKKHLQVKEYDSSHSRSRSRSRSKSYSRSRSRSRRLNPVSLYCDIVYLNLFWNLFHKNDYQEAMMVCSTLNFNLILLFSCTANPPKQNLLVAQNLIQSLPLLVLRALDRNHLAHQKQGTSSLVNVFGFRFFGCVPLFPNLNHDYDDFYSLSIQLVYVSCCFSWSLCFVQLQPVSSHALIMLQHCDR